MMNESGVLPPLGYSVLMTLEQGVLMIQESGVLIGQESGILSKLNTSVPILHILSTNKIILILL